MIRVCPGEIGNASRMTSPSGLESITRDCGRLQNDQGFMLLSLSLAPNRAGLLRKLLSGREAPTYLIGNFFRRKKRGNNKR